MTLTLTQLKDPDALPLLKLLAKTAQNPLKIEPIPPGQLISDDERFWLIHGESGLRIPGQFSADEADFILEISQRWNWQVDPQTREPGCRVQLLHLLEEVCAKTQHSAEEGVEQICLQPQLMNNGGEAA